MNHTSFSTFDLWASFAVELKTSLALAALILVAGLWIAKKVRSIPIRFFKAREYDNDFSYSVLGLVHTLLISYAIAFSVACIGISTTSMFIIVAASFFAISLGLLVAPAFRTFELTTKLLTKTN